MAAGQNVNGCLNVLAKALLRLSVARTQIRSADATNRIEGVLVNGVPLSLGVVVSCTGLDMWLVGVNQLQDAREKRMELLLVGEGLATRKLLERGRRLSCHGG